MNIRAEIPTQAKGRLEWATRPTARLNIEQVKGELKARGNEFIAAQRLNSLKSEVISETDVDDPYITNPIRITAVDYHKPYLIYKFSAAPPHDWIMAFRDPRSGFSSYMGKGPEYFDFQSDKAQIPLGGGEDPQQMTNYAKNFVELANRRYAEVITKKHRDNLAAQRKAQLQRIQDAEERQAMLARVSQIQL